VLGFTPTLGQSGVATLSPTPIVDSMLKIAKNFVGFKPKMLVKIKS